MNYNSETELLSDHESSARTARGRTVIPLKYGRVCEQSYLLGTEKHVLWFELSNRNHDTQLELWYLINLRDWVPVRFVVMTKL